MTWAASFRRSRPVSTNTHVSCAPMARWISAAATEQPVPFCVVAVLYALHHFRMPASPNLRIPELTHQSVFHHSAQLCRHGLHAITDTQNGDAEFEHQLRRARRAALGDRGRPAGK